MLAPQPLSQPCQAGSTGLGPLGWTSDQTHAGMWAHFPEEDVEAQGGPGAHPQWLPSSCMSAREPQGSSTQSAEGH